MQNYFDGGKMSFAAINCNLLNMSNSAKWNQSIKIYGITKLKTDVIFLSDVRLSNKNLVSAKDDISKQFLNNPYEQYQLYANSTKNKRGVGILIKHSLQAVVEDSYQDEDENILLLKVNIKGTVLVLISIYGPNNTDLAFFERLSDQLNVNSNLPVIMAGDWNCTFSTNPLISNPDCLNMKRVPNLTHSRKLSEICDTYNVTDPFRFFNSNSKDFTYVLRNDASTNKSRLDFFIVSDELLDFVTDCYINPGLQNKLFDHKAINLVINDKKPTGSRGNIAISNKELDDELLDYLVAATVCETYLIHTEQQIIEGRIRNNLLELCGRMKWLIRDCGPPPELITGNQPSVIEIEERSRKIIRLQILKNSIDLPSVENVNLTCGNDIFLETLLINVKNEVVSHQSFMRKKKLEKIDELKKLIVELKSNYTENENKILENEKKLNDFLDTEMRAELQKFKNYEILHMEKMTPRFLTLSKIGKNQDSLLKLKGDDGTNFISAQQRTDHIRNYYREIYRDKTPNFEYTENTIPEFLGPEICNHPVIE
jgi:exonuclease III